MTENLVTLQGGPYDGLEVPRSGRWSRIQLEGDRVPDGHVAIYRPVRRDASVQVFDRFARVIVRVEMPEPQL